MGADIHYNKNKPLTIACKRYMCMDIFIFFSVLFRLFLLGERCRCRKVMKYNITRTKLLNIQITYQRYSYCNVLIFHHFMNYGLKKYTCRFLVKQRKFWTFFFTIKNISSLFQSKLCLYMSVIKTLQLCDNFLSLIL